MMRNHVETLAKPMQIRPQRRYHRQQRGYTLMELMIAVAIVAILATLALNSYSSSVMRSRRAAVQAYMQEVASRQEQLMLDARAYSTASPPLPALPAELVAHYTAVVTADNTATPPEFLITATPIGTQLANDGRCGTLSLDQLGTRTETGAGTVAECW